MAVVLTWKRHNFAGKYKQIVMKYTYGNGDTTVTAATGLKNIVAYALSPTSVTAKAVDFATVAGGTITITVADPLAACYLFVTAWGL